MRSERRSDLVTAAGIAAVLAAALSFAGAAGALNDTVGSSLSGSAPKPEATDSKYCVYDAAHKGYLYTEAWVNKLSKDLADAQAFQRVIGSTPVAQ